MKANEEGTCVLEACREAGFGVKPSPSQASSRGLLGQMQRKQRFLVFLSEDRREALFIYGNVAPMKDAKTRISSMYTQLQQWLRCSQPC